MVALGVAPLLSWVQGLVVTSSRKAAKVPYPNAYATPEQAKENRDAYKFNCAQRAHVNLMENLPQTMAFMLFAGLEHPTAATGLGLGWVACRMLYAYGYITSQKVYGKGRLYGSGFWLLQGGLWALSLATAYKMI